MHKQLELFPESWASNNEDAKVPDCCQIVPIKVFDIHCGISLNNWLFPSQFVSDSFHKYVSHVWEGNELWHPFRKSAQQSKLVSHFICQPDRRRLYSESVCGWIQKQLCCWGSGCLVSPMSPTQGTVWILFVKTPLAVYIFLFLYKSVWATVHGCICTNVALCYCLIQTYVFEVLTFKD